ncbi:hypothetical protein DKX38_020804 [Salix brachista]|uniref:Uncharacterized protein n=1 Tax=Salix brachista TaxID=2182728 RepID=A0A5N5KDD8_9ROSI|nr:hypothetical protein DKX38_020804 [Salix brachista]
MKPSRKLMNPPAQRNPSDDLPGQSRRHPREKDGSNAQCFNSVATVQNLTEAIFYVMIVFDLLSGLDNHRPNSDMFGQTDNRPRHYHYTQVNRAKQTSGKGFEKPVLGLAS